MKNKWNYLIPLLAIFSTIALGVTIKQSVSLTSFNAGELSPLMQSRVDFAGHKSGAKTLQNMLVRAQGPVSRRPGTKYIASIKDDTDATRLIPFEYSTSDAYIIELGDGYARFYRSGAQILSGENAYEIVTPWDESDVFELQFCQDAETMRIVHPDYEPYKLTRTGHTSWTCTAINSTTGPFLDENNDTTWTLTSNKTTGTGATITSTDDLFLPDPNYVGALFQISHSLAAGSVTKLFWSYGDSTSDSITVQKYRYYDVITSGSWAGTFKIQRSYGDDVWEDVYSIRYTYNGNIQYSGQETEKTCLYRMKMVDQYLTSHNLRHYEGMCYGNFNARGFMNNGVVEITGVTNTKIATADIKIAIGAADTTTYHWSEGAWSNYRGWPRTVEHHEQRVIYGGSASYPQTIWASIIATQDSDYDDFTANTESDSTGNLGGPDDIAWTYTLPGMNPIQWMKSTEYLMIGTTSGVGKLGQPDKPITPNFPPTFRIQNHNGCAYIQPKGAVDALLYIERGGQKVRELAFAYSSDKYEAPDMTVLAEHITGDGIVEIDFQNRPEPILWCVREDGQLLSFTYHRKHDVLAWSRNNTGIADKFKSVAVIPGSDEDELWAIVDRNVDTYVEQFQPWDWGTDQNDCYFVDCAVDDITNLTHIEGETVALFADGRPIGTYTVSGGEISPSGSYTYTTVGLPYTSVFETVPLIVYAQNGTSLGKNVRVLGLTADFYETLGCHIGTSSSYNADIKFSDDSFATTVDVFNGIKLIPFARGWSRSPTIYLTESTPVPVTLRGYNVDLEATFD